MHRRYYATPCLAKGLSRGAFCGQCYENRKQRANHKGHRYFVGPHYRRATYEEMTMKRPSQATRPKKGEFTCPDAAFLSTYPILAAGMCDPFWDDGKPRDPWSLKIQFREDAILFTLNDKDSKLVAFTTAQGLVEGLLAIEAALESGGLSWRKSRW